MEEDVKPIIFEWIWGWRGFSRGRRGIGEGRCKARRVRLCPNSNKNCWKRVRARFRAWCFKGKTVWSDRRPESHSISFMLGA